MNWTKLIFFGVFYIGIGTIGITIPMGLNGPVIEDIAIGLVTIVISTAGYASTEKILMLQSEKCTKLEILLNMALPFIFFLSTVFVAISISNGHKNLPLSIGITTYVISCAFWWYQNRDNKNFEDYTGPLGGKI